MTGFARQSSKLEKTDVTFEWVWEIKSVNGKSLDVKARVPSWLDEISLYFKNIAQKYFERGSLSVYLDFSSSRSDQAVSLNQPLFEEVMKLVNVIKENGGFETASAGEILNIPGLFEVDKKRFDEELISELHGRLLKNFEDCCQSLQMDRQKEGEKIKTVLEQMVDKIAGIVDKIAILAKNTPQTLKEKLQQQINELLENNVQITEERLAQEVVLLVNRADIREEIDRLNTHIATAREMMSKNQTLGRKFDFLCQEFNREANTTCSKASNIEIVNLGMELKATIEQLREQVQNME